MYDYEFDKKCEKINNLLAALGSLTLYADEGEVYINSLDGYEINSIKYPEISHFQNLFSVINCCQ